MKKVFIVTIIILILTIFAIPTYAGTSDKTLVNSYCKKHYKNYSVKYVKFNSKKLQNRKNKKVVYVEICKSKSCGKYGYINNKYYIRYNTKVKKNKTVVSYCIYNPKNNICDDVVAIVDNKKIR